MIKERIRQGRDRDTGSKYITSKVLWDDAEWKQLIRLQQHSGEKGLSAYIRNVALKQPVIIYYRNGSADDFLEHMFKLKNAMDSIVNRFDQAATKLSQLQNIPEFRSWLHSTRVIQQSLIEKVEEMKLRMNQLYEQWLRE